MADEKIISFAELSGFGSVDTINSQAHALVLQQKSAWETVARNFDALRRIQTKTYSFDYFEVQVQFNAERIRSSGAKTDAKSIAARRCFLCSENLPAVQKGILLNDNYLLLVNPYPIFSEHFTISSLIHVPQNIAGRFADMLDVSAVLPDFTVFYNGPECGASAPDHFHFQAGSKNILPVEQEFGLLEKEHPEVLVQDENTKIVAVDNYLRHFVAFISSQKNQLLVQLENFYHILAESKTKEPMMNVLCNFEGGFWRVLVFPREKQRPSHFYREGDGRILVSPAAVELGGILILPREEDFLKIKKNDAAEILEEVTLNTQRFKNSVGQLKKCLH